MARPSWDEYFLEITRAVARRSTCLRRPVGAIIVRDKRILTTGYNGAPAAMPHCSEAGCVRQELGVPAGERHELCRGLHAEQNALLQAALHGIGVAGATSYCTTAPCLICAKMLINAGLHRVVFLDDYPAPRASEFLAAAGVVVDRFDGAGKEDHDAAYQDQDDCLAETEPARADTRGHGPEIDGRSGRTGEDDR